MPRPPYPRARTVDQVDVYHATSVADPYRWMEDLSDPELGPWLDAQLAITASVLDAIPCRDAFRKRLEELSSDGSDGGIGAPVFRGGRIFQSRSEPGEDGKLYLVDEPQGEGRPVFDLGPREGVVVADLEPSPDGRLLKWCESVGGSDWRTWRFLDVDSGSLLPDVVEGTKLWSRWTPGSDGLLYTAFPSSEEGATRKTAVPQLKLHRLGTPASDDELIYENPSSPSYFFPSVTEDRIVLTFLYEPGSSIAWAPIGGPYEFRRIIRSDDQLWLVGTRGDTFYVATTNDAPYGRIVAVDASGDGEPVTVVPETDVPMPMVARSMLVGERLFVAREHLGRSFLSMHARDGSSSHEIELPGVCRFVNRDVAEPVSASPDGRHIWFGVTMPSSPGSLLRHDTEAHTTDVVFTPSSASTIDVEAQVVWATSADGTQVPMTLIRSAAFCF